MRYKILPVVTVALLFFQSLALAQGLTEEQAAYVIAQVGDEVITAGDFARDLEFRLAQMKSVTGQAVKPDVTIRRALMNELVQERILSIAARNSGIEVTDEELEADFLERKEVFDSEDAYQNYLSALKLTEDALKQHMRSRIRIKNFIERETGPLSATDEELESLYALLKSQGKMTRISDTRDLVVVMLRAKGGSDESWRAAEDRAKAAKARIDGGEPVEQVAREVSEDPNTAPNGGKLLEIPVGGFYPELEEAMKNLELGVTSEPIRSVMGWYLITIVQVNKPGTVPLEKVKDQLEAQVVGDKRKEIVAKIVNDTQKLIRVELFDMENQPAAPVGSQ